MSEANVMSEPKRPALVQTYMSEANVMSEPKRPALVQTYMGEANVMSELHYQIDRRRVSEHVTPQSGRAVAFSTNCHAFG
jgi:hypothetical protein